MKKNYVKPSMKVFEMKIGGSLLQASYPYPIGYNDSENTDSNFA